jgi:sulfur-oxidizing protein SoxZ
METGQRKDKKTGKPIPAHFVQNITVEHGGKTRVSADWSGGVSKNPLLFVKFKGGAKGEMVKVAWTDNQGGSDSAEAEIN